jgi:hypothetical protein
MKMTQAAIPGGFPAAAAHIHICHIHIYTDACERPLSHGAAVLDEENYF